MKALMLAAGMGTRLSGFDDSASPKSLLRFGGKSLLERHVGILRELGVEELVIVVGYHAEEIEDEIAAIGAGDFVRFLHNPRYREGSVVSMWTARELLREGGPVLFMDADVLYDKAIIQRMLATTQETCLPYDRDFEEGDEPVKFCLRDGVPVEFRKIIDEVAFDLVGEWVGFIRMSPDFAADLAVAVTPYAEGGDVNAPYEEAVRDLLLGDHNEIVAACDITGLPWIEIDFPEDVVRAEQEILPVID
jgi:choline kinase